jgi:hypothetical protein
MYRSHAEPLLVAKTFSEGGRDLQLMDTEGTALAMVDLWWEGTFWACLDDLVRITSGTHVFDLATCKETLLKNCSKSAKEGGTWRFSFGRTAQSGVYKVFRHGYTNDSHRLSWQVLTVGDGDGADWRQTKSPPAMVHSCHGYTSGVTVGGALHFLSRNEEEVLRFDLQSEEWKVIRGPLRDAGQRVIISIAELNGALCLVQTMTRVTTIWRLVDPNRSIWVNAYTMDIAVISFVVPLRVLRPGGKLLFYYVPDRASKPMLKVYDPRLRICTGVKMPANVVGEIGLCSSHFDPRLCGQT